MTQQWLTRKEALHLYILPNSQGKGCLLKKKRGCKLMTLCAVCRPKVLFSHDILFSLFWQRSKHFKIVDFAINYRFPTLEKWDLATLGPYISWSWLAAATPKWGMGYASIPTPTNHPVFPHCSHFAFPAWACRYLSLWPRFKVYMIKSAEL